MNRSENLCNRCILPDSFPKITFNDQGICNYCQKEEKSGVKGSVQKESYKKKLDELINGIKGKAPDYDVIVAYSGGKDSSYTLKLLRDYYDLRILALIFDNHFVSPAAMRNIHRVTDHLTIDSLMFRPPFETLKQMFAMAAKENPFSTPTLMRASSICTACIGLVKSIVLKTCLEKSIPLVAFGWSPGQAPIQSAIMKTNSAFIRQTQSAQKKAFSKDLLEKLTSYFIPDSYYERCSEMFPYNVHPLAFFDYDEDKIVEILEGIGWKNPKDTDTNSTNCLLNAYANKNHIDQNGFHPYVWEIANMVRQGIIKREDGIAKIYSEQDEQMVAYAQERLGL